MEMITEDQECIQECVIKECFYFTSFLEKFNGLGMSIRKSFLEQIPDFQFNMLLPAFDTRVIKRKNRDVIISLKITPLFRVVVLVMDNTGFFLDIDAEYYIDKWVDRVPVYSVAAMLRMKPESEPEVVLGPHFQFQGVNSRGCLWLNSACLQLMNLYAAFSLNVLMRKLRREFSRFQKRRSSGKHADMSVFLSTDDFQKNLRDPVTPVSWFLRREVDDFRKGQSEWANNFKRREFQSIFAGTAEISAADIQKVFRKTENRDVYGLIAGELEKAVSGDVPGTGRSGKSGGALLSCFRSIREALGNDAAEGDIRPALMVFSAPEEVSRMEDYFTRNPALSQRFVISDPASLLRIAGRRLGILFQEEPDQFQDCFMRGFHAGADLMAVSLPDSCRDNPRITENFNPRFIRASYIQEILDGGFFENPEDYAFSERVTSGEDLPWSPGLFLEIVREYCVKKRELRLWDYRELLNIETLALRSPQFYRVRIPGTDAGSVYAAKQLFLEYLEKNFEIGDTGIKINSHVFEISLKRKPAYSRVICMRPDRMSISELRFLCALAGDATRVHGISWQSENLAVS